MPEEVDRKYENRKNHEQKLTDEKLEKLDRQKQVYLLDLQGYKNKEIADKLGVSLSTIEKDLHEIRESAGSWFIEISKSGASKAFVDSLLQVDIVQKELWQIYRNTNEKSEKLKLLRAITETAAKKRSLFSYTRFGPYSSNVGC